MSHYTEPDSDDELSAYVWCFRRMMHGLLKSIERDEIGRHLLKGRVLNGVAGWRRHAVFWRVCDCKRSQTSQNARCLRHPLQPPSRITE
jgi:hypothetical protein